MTWSKLRVGNVRYWHHFVYLVVDYCIQLSLYYLFFLPGIGGFGSHFRPAPPHAWQLPGLCGGAGSQALGLHHGTRHRDQRAGGWQRTCIHSYCMQDWLWALVSLHTPSSCWCWQEYVMKREYRTPHSPIGNTLGKVTWRARDAVTYF